MREYEALLVLQPELEDEGVEEIIGHVASAVEADGGEVERKGQLVDKKGTIADVEESWSTRRLAYTINGHDEGYFVIVHYRGPAESVESVEQALRLNEDVLRFLVTKTEL